jgi:hypothetical protein
VVPVRIVPGNHSLRSVGFAAGQSEFSFGSIPDNRTNKNQVLE